MLNKDQINGLISQRLTQFRPRNWEDDISFNSIEDQPFENLPSIAEFADQFNQLDKEKISLDQIKAYAANDTAALPCPKDREGYSANYHVRYWFTGLSDYLSILEAAERLNIDIQRYFDFGCASGRVLRHFVAQSEIEELWGSDINARHIRWLYEHLPMRVKPIANHAIPHLPVADNYFDVISAFSVFTHIDTFETCWLAELKRILKPGGMAYLTIHNEDTWAVLRDEIDNSENRLINSMEMADPDVKEKLKGEMPEGRTVYRFTHRGPYRCQVFHSNSFIKNVWGRFFDDVEILPCHHVRQLVVILK